MTGPACATIGRDRERRWEAVQVGELRERYATLTSRERQIMRLVVVGLANKQSAAELEVSEMTVKVHRGQVMRKMQARSLPELVRMADRLGLPATTPADGLYQNRSAIRPASSEMFLAADEHARGMPLDTACRSGA